METDSRFTHRDYLRKEQYRDGDNLRSRASLHEKFSTNPLGWHTWVFAQLDLPAAAAILEVGCGPGWLWRENIAEIPIGWQVILSDLSSGMVSEAKRSLDALQNYSYLSFDVKHPPLPASHFDAIIANHMLYHVPDVNRALATLHSLLKPGGVFYATTIGRTHLQEIASFISRATGDPAPEKDNVFQRSVENFNLQNGRQQLLPLFTSVERRIYPDSLEVDDPQSIIDYVESSPVFDLSSADRARLKALLQQEIVTNGHIAISKESGLFIAHKIVNA
jgi:ubiquinone/menaquinone biosynthesis C-methylase UbiE